MPAASRRFHHVDLRSVRARSRSRRARRSWRSLYSRWGIGSSLAGRRRRVASRIAGACAGGGAGAPEGYFTGARRRCLRVGLGLVAGGLTAFVALSHLPAQRRTARDRLAVEHTHGLACREGRALPRPGGLGAGPQPLRSRAAPQAGTAGRGSAGVLGGGRGYDLSAEVVRNAIRDAFEKHLPARRIADEGD